MNNPSPTVTGASHALRESSPHSPLPWSIDIDGKHIYIVFDAGTIASVIASVGPCGDPDAEDHANAALIVLAVNNHAALVAALQRALGFMRSSLPKPEGYCFKWLAEPPEPCSCEICQAESALKQAGGAL